MRPFVAVLALVLAAGRASAAEEERSPVLLADPSVAADMIESLIRDAGRRGVEVAAPAPPVEPASESILEPVRALYREMSFRKAVERLRLQEGALVAGRVPTPGVTGALADVELWLGAALVLSHEREAALERFELAKELSGNAKPERIFPPEVHDTFALAHPRKAVTVAIRLAPTGTRLWVDGHLAEGDVRASPGLHYFVADRADLVAEAQIVRVTHAGAQVAMSLSRPASAPDALRQAAARLRVGPLSSDESVGVSRLLKRSLWLLSQEGSKLQARRSSARDEAQSRAQLEDSAPSSLVDRICQIDKTCSPLIPTPAPQALVATGVVERKPVWRRGWFWGVVAAGAAVIAAGAIGVAIAVNGPQDYVVHVR